MSEVVATEPSQLTIENKQQLTVLNKSLNIPFPAQPNNTNHLRQPHSQPIDSSSPDEWRANYETIGREFEPLRARHLSSYDR